MPGRDSSAPKLRVAAPIDFPEEKPRAKPLRVLTNLSLTADAAARRTEQSNRRAALKLLQLREETGLTQVDAATLESLSSKSIGRYERDEVDLAPLRYYLALLEFRARQRGDR